VVEVLRKNRVAVHDAVKKCLGIGTLLCKFDQQCILEGKSWYIATGPNKSCHFTKVREFSQAGRYLGCYQGCAEDSPTPDEEHLMIMFYDLLLLDDILWCPVSS
jgi:DNA ligase 4